MCAANNADVRSVVRRIPLGTIYAKLQPTCICRGRRYFQRENKSGGVHVVYSDFTTDSVCLGGTGLRCARCCYLDLQPVAGRINFNIPAECKGNRISGHMAGHRNFHMDCPVISHRDVVA